VTWNVGKNAGRNSLRSEGGSVDWQPRFVPW